MGQTPNRFVFINCPFDSEYRPLFEAIVFTICACDYSPCCALGIVDSAYNRLTKILDLIDLCDFSLHDISRTELNPNQLPRFNMPFELGLAFGRKKLPRNGLAAKVMVLDRAPHRYLEFLSDLRGCDPVAHHDDPFRAIEHVRDWLSSQQPVPLNGPLHFNLWFRQFQDELPCIATECGLDRSTMSFNDLVFCVRYWLEASLPAA